MDFWDLEPAGYTRFSKVRLPVDTAFFGLQEDDELVAMVQQLEYVLFVGRIVPQKDVLSIVRVFAEVQKHLPEAVLFLVGGTDTLPPYVERVREEIRKLGIENRVQMTGKISDRAALTTLYRHAKFLISLSDWENCCVPSGEAMFFGLPVINAGAVPMPENVGDAGVMIDKTDPVSAGKLIAGPGTIADVYARLQSQRLASIRVVHRCRAAGSAAKRPARLDHGIRCARRRPSIAGDDTMRLAFVVQRYGLEINGGAEVHCRQLAERMSRHMHVEVLTTCAEDHYTWRNVYPGRS